MRLNRRKHREANATERDYRLEDHGSIWLVQPMNLRALEHLQAHTDGQWFGGALAVEPRYVLDLSERLQDDGFSVEGSI